MAFFGNLEADKYDRQYSDGYLVRRIGQYAGRYRSQVVRILFGFVLLSIMQALRPVLISVGIDALETESNTLWLIVGALLISALIDYGANWERRRMLAHVIGKMVAQLRKDAFSSALNRDMAFYDTNKTGKVLSRITSDTQEFGDVLIFTSDVLAQLTSVALLIVVLFNQSVTLTIVLLFTLPMFLLAAILFRNWARQVTRQSSRALAIVNDNIQESVTGISVAKNYRRENMIYDEFKSVNTLSYQTNIRRGAVIALVFPVMNALVGFAIAVVVLGGASAVINGTILGISIGAITAGSWYLFVQSVDRFLFPVINMASFWSQFQQGMSAIERVFALIDTENAVQQRDDVQLDKLDGHVVFDDVTFGYTDDQPVLKNFKLDIQPGESVAFVGHTGAGKSTIAKLIERFYEFQDGQICIDGHDIRDLNLQAYRSKLGIVPQQPFLFSGTVLDNVRYARPDATEAEIEAIARSIGDGEWLDSLPNGLHTDVGERGARLSMGQRQLVSLLRVLVQKPGIFILDEATASIDPFTETQIQEAIDMILRQASSILIAHRLSTVRSADRIIVLKSGEIIEQGSHDELMAQAGHYAELYNTYFRHQSLSYIENSRELFEAAGD